MANLLLRRLRRQDSERFLNQHWNWWWRRQVITLGLESVLVGHVLQRDLVTLGIGVREATLGNLRNKTERLVTFLNISSATLLLPELVPRRGSSGLPALRGRFHWTFRTRTGTIRQRWPRHHVAARWHPYRPTRHRSAPQPEHKQSAIENTNENL